MASGVHIEVSKLTSSHFERDPVWTWVDDFYSEDLVTPVAETDPIPKELDTVFIKADFWTPSGLRFYGHVVTNTTETYVADLDIAVKYIVQPLPPPALITGLRVADTVQTLAFRRSTRSLKIRETTCG